MRTVLTVAGSDSIAGAGIQADLKTFAALGVYGVSAVTAITAQNTRGVTDVFPLSADIVRAQIEQLAQDAAVAAVKTGMLATAEIVEVVAETIGRVERPNLVVDPVMAASGSGMRTLLAPEAVSILKTRLFPIAAVVTPNVSEAAALCGTVVDSPTTAREAAKRIVDLGPEAVVIKGGHWGGAEALDLVLHAGTFIEFPVTRVNVGAVHGAGCTFASAIAAGLALGDDIPAAVHRAKRYVTGAIEHSFEIGRGARLLNHFWDSPSPR
jgi:hydroxymethylpyrimidine/phosphomethylpyrimidine kinase